MRNQNMQHFVDKHLLIPLYLDAGPGEELYCKACELLIVEPFHGCLACKNYLHHHCLNISRSILHPSHPSHPLTLLSASTYPSGSFCCNACGETGNGFTYSCAHCEFDLHLKCATLLPEEVKLVDKHPHDLKLEFKFYIHGGENVIFVCDVCGGAVGKDLWRYYCGDCDFGVHVGCVKEVTGTVGLVYAVAEGKSGTAELSTQPPSGAVGGGGGGGGGMNEGMNSYEHMSNEIFQQQLQMAMIQAQANLAIDAGNAVYNLAPSGSDVIIRRFIP